MDNSETKKIKKTSSVIDLKLGAKILGSKENAKETLAMLIEMLPNDQEKVKLAYANHDYQKLQYLVHYMKGGISYCGTPLLQIAVTEFYDTLINNSDPATIQKKYEAFCNEIQAVLTEYSTLNENNK